MTPERYAELDLKNARLTQEEVNEGWHFCPDWDFMLVNKKDPESEECYCEHLPHIRSGVE